MLTKEEVVHIAKLARLELTDQEVAKMQKDLAEILEYIDQLNKVDVSEVELEKEKIISENVLRKDVPISQSPETIEKMLEQAPEREGGHIKVKEILT
ncbi:MAG: Asp-tRNA(Asn)/Glu-tRNA(Gln) amidotransferase subunit GatC [Candidatus Pacebacteria bacterium]|nr:Asp-tRNA(Asn)/Glu-tRNA(Gln) amidotransferase subunit GatC [Candidatus Paceibacterota bacterium]